MKFDIDKIKTLGQLKEAGYVATSIKEELRANLIEHLKKKTNVFKGVIGFEDTVIPDIERAILSRHNIILLGLRGQAKTRIARQMTALLDEYIPIVEGSELNDDPLRPLSRYALDLIAQHGEETPVAWLHRDDRYSEKLATPDVSIADLIGDVDPIKAANMKLSYSDERVIHFGLIPRSHRCIFVINELPDLQPRIQVALFNILQEGDIQIRGFKIRLPLQLQFVFTANPEDYTNRGSIVTPLKDRIESQILTHYPKDVAISQQITQQEARLTKEQKKTISANDVAKLLIEHIAFEARSSEFVDENSGVSARLTISAYENLISAAERRMLINREKKTHLRIGDFWGVIPAITGKIELVYEGEQEGPFIVAQNLIGKAIANVFVEYFPNPEKKQNPVKGRQQRPARQPKPQKPAKAKANPYQTIVDWFGQGKNFDLMNDLPQSKYTKILMSIPGLSALVDKHHPDLDKDTKLFFMEFVLHGLAEHSLISKNMVQSGFQFKDLLGSIFNFEDVEEDDDIAF